MSNVLSSYGWPILVFVLLALITWGPTLVSFFRKRRQGSPVRVRHLLLVLFGELGVLLALAAGAEAVGVRNAGAYLLAIALLIGAAGAQLFGSRRFQ